MSLLTRLASLLGFGRRRAPARVPTDQVLPLQWYDDTDVVGRLLVTWTLVFKGVLDADKLAAALSRLAEIGDWKKIGGRIRLNSRGKLELHVPEKFTPERRALDYVHETLDISIVEHPLASRLPKPTPEPSLQEPATVFRRFGSAPGAPASLDDYLRTDRPSLALYITSFTDATLVSIQWPHCLSDGTGLAALIENWTRVLDGREAEVQPVKGVYDDPWTKLDADPEAEEPYALADKLLRGLHMALFVMRFIFRVVFLKVQRAHCIFLPAAAVARLRERALRDLADMPGSGPALPPFLSDGDILTAWATKMLCASLGKSSRRSVGVFNAVNLRGRIPGIFDPSAVYLGNFNLPCWTNLVAGEVAASPLGCTAAALRSSLMTQTTAAQVRALVRVSRDQARGGAPLALGDPGAVMMACSSWAKAKILEVADFRAAVVDRRGDEDTSSGPTPGTGWPVYFHGLVPNGVRMARDAFNITGKDAQGNYYMMAAFSEKTWAAFEEEIRTLQQA